jgi:single-strand DNA-binding protein
MNTTVITICGNCADAPELRFTPDGKATARMQVAVSERYPNAEGTWVNGPTSWHTVLAWGRLAEHAVDSINKGDRVTVHGRLAQREYTTEAGERRTVWEVTAVDIGLSLRHISASPRKPGAPVPAQG